MVDKYDLAKQYYETMQYSKAYKLILELAKNGDTKSQVILAELLYFGHGVEVDKDKSYYWFNIAIEKNNLDALYSCGLSFIEDTEKSIESCKYLEQAAKLGHKKAIIALASFYTHGQYCFKRDINKAISLYKKACILKDKNSCLNLYLILKENNNRKEFKEFVNREIGPLNYAKIILKGNWMKCLNAWKYIFRRDLLK